jgi:HK97 family phage major capsid protein
MRTNLHLALTATAVALCLGCISHDVGPAGKALPRIFAEGVQMEHLQARLAELDSQAKNILAFAESEKRSLNSDEVKELDKIYAAFEEVDAEIKVRERAANMSARAAGGGGRQTNPDLTPAQVAAAAASAAGSDDGAAPAQQSPALARRLAASARTTDTGKWGFRSAGEFIVAVFRASARGATPDPRLIANAPTTFGSEGTGADGGFAVPPDFRATIIKKVAGEESLLSMTDQQTTSSNSITFPLDETTPWQSSGGIQVYWESEAGQKTQSKPQLKETTVKANKIIALVPMTDELLDDAPAMTSWLNSKVPEHIDYAVNAAIINGTGVGQPLGILRSSGLVTVTAESGQVADTIVFDNVVNMYTRMPAPSKRRAVWLINEDIEAQLMKMSFPGTGTAVPVYMPPGGLSAAPYGTLMGRPVMPMEACSALGDVGDIIFADMMKYMTLVKGGLKQDISIHLFFDYDVTAFRFVLRIGGKPWFNSTITRANGLSRGFFVTLGAR